MLKTIKHFSLVTGGTAIGHAVALSLAPILTRIVTPETFGVFSVYMMVIALLSLVSTMGYEASIVNAKTKEEANIFAGIALGFTLIISLFIALPALFITSIIMPSLQFSPPLIALGISATIFSNIFLILQFLSIRGGHYTHLGAGNLTNSAGKALGQVAMAFAFNGAAIGLAIGDNAGRAACCTVVSPRGTLATLIKTSLHNRDKIWALMKRDSKNAFFYMPSMLTETFFIWLPIPFFTAIYGPETAGYIAMIQRIFSAPVALVGRSLGDVYHGKTQHLTEDPRLVKITLITLLSLLALFVPVCAVLMLLGEEGFAFILGDNWRGAASYAYILAPILAFQTAVPLMTRFGIIVKATEIKLIFMVLICIALTGVFLYAQSASLPLNHTLILFSGLTCAGYALFYCCLLGVGLLKIRKKQLTNEPCNNDTANERPDNETPL